MVRKGDFPDIKWVINEWGEFPSFYSDNACRIIADKYFADGEISLWDMVYRVVHAIGDAGRRYGYFEDDGEQAVFQRHLAGMLINQEASFNSPVWFNVGVEEHPQCSACFIQSVEDNMDSILELAKKEGKLFKYGSGTGTNLSPIRARDAALSNGGQASGPVEFMKMYDAGAGVIKSGGKTRRAAKMVLLNDTHPDIMEFIRCKAEEEKKVKRLVEIGVPVEEAYDMAHFQNGNNSVRISDETMLEKHTAHNPLLWAIAEAAWECGDPGVQFHDTINAAMPDERGEPLVCTASNPCSEFLFIDESACNLASINVGRLNQYDEIRRATNTLITAMDIIVDMSSYPTEEIRKNSIKYRPLGLGITNLGAYLMRTGVPYDSNMGRDIAAKIMEWIHVAAEDQSRRLADKLGSNWGSALRNAQLTLVAPTGTISFMMDCESTGVEPVFAERQTKYLVGGGTLSIVPKCMEEGLKWDDDPMTFQTAIGSNPVSAEGHLKMMAAIQPYLSGAISKTVNLPNSATVQDIYDIYYKAWKLGIKCIAVYRDGCKAHQPLQVEGGKSVTVAQTPVDRIRLDDTRHSITHKFTINGTSGYLTAGLYDNGAPGELFVNISKEGSTVGGLMDAWATSVSLGLQYGVPLSKFVRKFKGSRFEPAGFTKNSAIPSATSIVDYISQWLERHFLSVDQDGEEDEWSVEDEIVHIESSGNTCPDCGGITIVTGRCYSCPHCGWNGGCG
jgi:ribonucleoside-diphosphate reductase alpha chain